MMLNFYFLGLMLLLILLIILVILGNLLGFLRFLFWTLLMLLLWWCLFWSLYRLVRWYLQRSILLWFLMLLYLNRFLWNTLSLLYVSTILNLSHRSLCLTVHPTSRPTIKKPHIEPILLANIPNLLNKIGHFLSQNCHVPAPHILTQFVNPLGFLPQLLPLADIELVLADG